MSVSSLPRSAPLRGLLTILALALVLVFTTSNTPSSVADEQRAAHLAQEARAAELAAERERLAASALREAAAEQAAEEAARAALETALADALAASVAAVTAAQAILDASAGKVADDIVRVQLAAALAAAQAAQSVPETDGSEEARTAELVASTAALAAAQLAVTDAQAAWEAEQARVAAEAAEDAKRTAPPAPKPAPPGGTPAPSPAPQCVNDSTYTGTPFYTSAPSASGDGSNGNIPASQMTRLSWGHDTVGTPQYLRTPAAQALDRLNAAYRARFGSDLDLDLTYRSYADQVAMRNELGSIAAAPGTSTHGTGNAIDVPEWSCYAFGSVRRDWLATNGPTYGWVSPSWARQGGSNPEYWHYEYVG